MRVEDILIADEFDIKVAYTDAKGNFISIFGIINLNKDFECYHSFVNGKNRFFDLYGESIDNPEIDKYTDDELEAVLSVISDMGGNEAIMKKTKEAYIEYDKEYNDPEYTKELIELGKLKGESI